jgi:hypothetical protein
MERHTQRDKNYNLSILANHEKNPLKTLLDTTEILYITKKRKLIVLATSA